MDLLILTLAIAVVGGIIAAHLRVGTPLTKEWGERIEQIKRPDANKDMR